MLILLRGIIIWCLSIMIAANTAHPLNVSLVNHFLTNGVTVTLQWYREAGATYNVNVLPLMALTNSTSHNMILLHLTIPYDSQYNVSIVSSVCGITTSRVLKYGMYEYVTCMPASRGCHYNICT